MEKLFDELSYATPKHLYVGKPVEEIKALNKQKSEDYTEARGTKDALDVAIGNLDVRDVDYDSKKNYLGGLKERLTKTVEQGDWQNAKYQITDEVKKFATDPILNAAKKERASELAYNKNISERFDKGDLSQEHASWARRQGQNTAVTLNPDGTIAGGFAGGKVLDDKKITKDIYETVDKRIKDWKEDKFEMPDGRQVEKRGNGQYFYKGTQEIVRPEEVRQALTNEVKNSYGDFLQQEKAVDLDRLKRGQNRSIELQDFQGLGLQPTVNDILQAKGLSDAEIKQMEASKDPHVKQQAEIAKNERKALETKLALPEGRDEVFNDLYDRQQLNKYIQGGTNKASYTKEDSVWMQDHFALENLKFKHDKALKEVEVQAPPSNIHAQEAYSLKDNESWNTRLADYNKQKNDLKNKLNTNLPTIEKNKILNELNDIENKIATANDVKAKAINTLSIDNPEVGKAYITYGLLSKDGINGVIPEVLKNANNYSTKLGGYLRQLKNQIEENSKKPLSEVNPISEQQINTLNDLISKEKNKDNIYKNAVEATNNVDDSYQHKILSRATPGRSASDLPFSKSFNIKNYLQEAENKALEKNNIDLVSTARTYGVTEDLKPASEALTDLFRNQETTATRNGLNWDKFISEQDLTDEQGKAIKGVENKNIQAYPEINWDKGEKTIRINVLNAYTEGKEGQKTQASWSFNPGSDDVADVTLREMGSKLIKSSKPDAKNAGRNMLAFSMYGKDLKGFNPQVMGEKAYTNITTPDGGVTTVMAKKSESGDTFKVYEVKKDNQGQIIKGTERELKLKVPGEGEARSDFRSSEDLGKALYYSQFEQ